MLKQLWVDITTPYGDYSVSDYYDPEDTNPEELAEEIFRGCCNYKTKIVDIEPKEVEEWEE